MSFHLADGGENGGSDYRRMTFFFGRAAIVGDPRKAMRGENRENDVADAGSLGLFGAKP